MLYFIPLATFLSVTLSAPVAVNAASGVGSCVFGVVLGRVITVSAVGVPDMVICEKLLRVTEIPFWGSTR